MSRMPKNSSRAAEPTAMLAGVTFDPAERTAQPAEGEAGDEERDAEAQRVGGQKGGALGGPALTPRPRRGPSRGRGRMHGVHPNSNCRARDRGGEGPSRDGLGWNRISR